MLTSRFLGWCRLTGPWDSASIQQPHAPCVQGGDADPLRHAQRVSHLIGKNEKRLGSSSGSMQSSVDTDRTLHSTVSV